MSQPHYTDDELIVTVRGTELTVTDPTGKTHTLHGFGAGQGRLQLDPRVDLTKPIFEQVERLRLLDEAEQEQAVARAEASSRPA